MKKRALTLLLVPALIAGAIALPAGAATLPAAGQWYGTWGFESIDVLPGWAVVPPYVPSVYLPEANLLIVPGRTVLAAPAASGGAASVGLDLTPIHYLPAGVEPCMELYFSDDAGASARIAPLSAGEPVAAKDGNEKYGFLSQSGGILAPLEYDGVRRFSEGYAAVMRKDRNGNEKYGFLNMSGKLVVPLEYDGADSFSDGLAPVMKRDGAGNAKYGLIDAAGREVLPLEYDAVEAVEGGFRVTKKDANGNRKQGFANSEGRLAVPASYDGIGGAGDSLVLVMNRDQDGEPKYGFVNPSNGRESVPLEYDAAYIYKDGLAPVAKKNEEGLLKYSAIDKDGGAISPFAYDDVWNVSGGVLVPVMRRDGNGRELHGFLGKTGEVLVNPAYDEVGAFSDGLSRVMQRGPNGQEKHGYVDSSGKLAVPLKYDAASTFCEGMAVVMRRNIYGVPRYGFIDKSGDESIELKYDGVSSFCGGYAVVMRKDTAGNARYGCVNGGGEEILTVKYAFVRPFKGMDLVQVTEESGRTGFLKLSELTAQTPAAKVNVASASTQSVEVDGRTVEFQMYALSDYKGNPTNYVRLRDVASVLNGTPAQFNIRYEGDVELLPGEAYVPDGTEMDAPFTGDQYYTAPQGPTRIDGKTVELKAILLTGPKGGGYLYYKLRDLGRALNFNVGWSKARGTYIETGRPYEG